MKFSDVTVDPSTGSFILRMVFPNQDHILLPGMFVRAIVEEGIAQNAILVPQQGVSRTPKGESVALVVDKTDTVQQRMLKLDRAIGNKWLVNSGLSAGDRVIIEGMLKVRSGAVVKVVFPDSTKGDMKAEEESQTTSGSNKGGR
jgi:membrane fusion protein (multidrug efflux system)